MTGSRSTTDTEQLNSLFGPPMMTPALHSHASTEEVPVYEPHPPQIGSSVPTYPPFPTSLHHVSSSDQNLSTYDASSSAEHHTLPTQHHHIGQHGIPLDRTVSHDSMPVDRHFPSSSTAMQQLEFHASMQTPAEVNNASRWPPPPPPLIPNSLPPGQFDMLPPPASTHPSWQSLHEYAQTHASAHGYALSINTTAKNRSRIKLACVCYGAPKNTHKLTPETRVRKNRVSYKTGCRMWIEGKKQEEGIWTLRVGEGAHNHPGRAVDGWAVQRKRTWGLQGGRVGVGGVTAKEEKERGDQNANEQSVFEDATLEQDDLDIVDSTRKASHSLESGGLVWKIVEQEMLRKGGPGQGRDRGVGRTVKILEERLPGIHIFKRDVYNIRAQIKRARKAAGQQLGEGLDESDIEEAGDEAQAEANARNQGHNAQGSNRNRHFSQIDPTLVEQCNSALQNIPSREQPEVDYLRREVQYLRGEVAELRNALAQRTKELNDKNSENDSLRVQVELDHMALYNDRGGSTQ